MNFAAQKTCVAFLAVVLFSLVLPTVESRAQTVSQLIAPVTTPGFGGTGPEPCGTNPAYLQPVLRYELVGALSPIPQEPVSGCPSTSINDPAAAAVSPGGEIFIANRHGNRGGGFGSISRFAPAPDGTLSETGVIAGNSLEAVHGLAFSPSGELFAANLLNGTISRFRFGSDGGAIPNGTIRTAHQNLGVAFSPWGELFVTDGRSIIHRFGFDRTGREHANGSFEVAGSSRLHFLAFSPSGELFVPDLAVNRVYRISFDSEHNPIQYDEIAVAGGPGGVAFGPSGELFVSKHLAGGIARFLLDDTGEAIPNGEISTANVGGIAIASLGPIEGAPIAELPADFAQTQGSGGLSYLSYGDDRPTNTSNPGHSEVLPLVPQGVQAIVNGSVVNTGLAFLDSALFFPYALHDADRDLLLVHPGTFANANVGLAVRYAVPVSGVYRLTGAFARANNFFAAGDGVDVAIFANARSDAPLFTRHIASDHVVNADDPFSGSGTAFFDFVANVQAGETIEFVVFSGPQGLDGTFDVTALQVELRLFMANPARAVTDLVREFERLEAEGSLSAEDALRLLRILELVLVSSRLSPEMVAVQLNRFIREVSGLVESSNLSVSDGEALIGVAEALIETLATRRTP